MTCDNMRAERIAAAEELLAKLRALMGGDLHECDVGCLLQEAITELEAELGALRA